MQHHRLKSQAILDSTTACQRAALAVVAGAAVLGLATGPLLSATQPPRPHVLLIYTDDQGYGDVSALNPESKFQTPNLDRLVREGVAFH